MPVAHDPEAVLAANARFYDAFRSLTLERMEAVWLQSSAISCVHPGWGALVGWGPVMESWGRIFGNTLEMRLTIANVHVEVHGDVAWVLLTEELESHHRDGKITAHVQATNVFRREGGGWLLVHHHGSPVYPSMAGGGSAQMH